MLKQLTVMSTEKEIKAMLDALSLTVEYNDNGFTYLFSKEDCMNSYKGHFETRKKTLIRRLNFKYNRLTEKTRVTDRRLDAHNKTSTLAYLLDNNNRVAYEIRTPLSGGEYVSVAKKIAIDGSRVNEVFYKVTRNKRYFTKISLANVLSVTAYVSKLGDIEYKI